jgi:mannose-1-phosphate guanylyltransferase
MKAFLLAAGLGTRLRPYTDTTPKCLLPICGVPILEIWLALCRTHGISEVLVNTHAHSAAVKSFVQGKDYGVQVRVIEEQQLFGSAGTLRSNRNWLAEETSFWVFYADVLTSADLRAMLRSHSSSCAATLGVYSVPDPRRCGIVSVNQDQVVTGFIEKPALPAGNLAFAGILIGTQQLLDTIPDKPQADLAFDVLPQLTGKMRAYNISSYLLDIGTIENYELAQKTWPGLNIRSCA